MRSTKFDSPTFFLLISSSKFQTKTPSVDDLIKLDDSLTLEDFDPLNAKLQLPAQPSASSSNTSITSSAVIGFSNPVYTFHEPKNLLAPQCNNFSNNTPKNNSVELLRDYGILDQYTNLVNGQTEAKQVPKGAAGPDKKTQQNNWMTFD